MLIGNNMVRAIARPAPFTHLVISPVQNASEIEAETDMVVCAPHDADIWGIYGIRENGVSEVLHNDIDPEKAGTLLLAFASQWNLPMGFISIEHVTPTGNAERMADTLAEIIHDEIPGYDDPEDFRDDDFENHPLAPLREIFVDTYGS